MGNDIGQRLSAKSTAVDERRRIVSELHERASKPLSTLQLELEQLLRMETTRGPARAALLECQDAADQLAIELKVLSSIIDPHR